MPVRIPETLPARSILESENVFVMTEERAEHQDIRPLRVAILNLMPTKIQTETQILRVLGNTALQVEVTLLHTVTHESKNTDARHLLDHYESLEAVRYQKFDGLIITGAPVETLPFDEVDYWPELCRFFDWAETNVYSTYYICWGAQAALYHRYGVPKYELPAKMFGVFEHQNLGPTEKILRGFDDVFLAPHSRHTEFRRPDLEKVPGLKILAESDEAGVYIAAMEDGRHVFVTGHAEYDRMTLKAEYDRDVSRGLEIAVPKNYYPNDDPSKPPVVRWRSHGHQLYANWLNYHVYQATPYDIERIPEVTAAQVPASSAR